MRFNPNLNLKMGLKRPICVTRRMYSDASMYATTIIQSPKRQNASMPSTSLIVVRQYTFGGKYHR